MRTGSFTEPNPIPVRGDGVFGNEIREEWVDFTGQPGAAVAGVFFSRVTWRWSNATTIR